MTDLLRPAKRHRVLEIGTGSGYQAAVLAQLVKSGFTRSNRAGISDFGGRDPAPARYSNVTVSRRDGHMGWHQEAPFDRIIVTARPPGSPSHSSTNSLPAAGWSRQ